MRADARRPPSTARALLIGSSLGVLAAAAAGPASASAVRTHVVRQGETLFHIAQLEHASVQALATLNRIAPPYRIFAGERLEILGHGARLTEAAMSPLELAEATLQGGPLPVARPGPAQPPTTPVTPPPPALPLPPPQPAPKLQRPVPLVLPLYDGPTYLGDMDAVIFPDGSVSVSTSELSQLTKGVLGSGVYAKLAAGLNGQTTRLVDITEAGLKAAYDPAQLRIVLTIPGADRGARSLALSDRDHALIGAVATPEPFSAYLNLRSSVDFVEAGTTAGRGAQDPTVLLNGAMRLNGFVLEADGQYAPGEPGIAAFTRQDTRVIYDDLPWFVRFTGGDLQVTTRSFQGGLNMAGFSIERLYSTLAPQENIQPRGSQSFTLERASTVQTIINGRTVQQIRLAPGVYNLNDFPFAQGANNVQLLIQDDSGQREALNFSIFFDRSLLKTGLTEFGLYGGVESSNIGGSVDYTGVPAVTGFVRHGFNDWLTAGANFQADSHVQMAGVESLWGTKIGAIGADLAVSHADVGGAGFALNLGYNLLQQLGEKGQSQSVVATVQYRSPNFATAGELTNFNHGALGVPLGGVTPVIGPVNPATQNQYAVQAGLNYNRTFSDYSFVGANVNYAVGRAGAANLGQFQVSYGRQLTETANAVLDFEYDTSGIAKGFSVRLSLTKRFGRTGSVRGDYDSAQRLGQVTVQDSHGRGVGSWNATGTLQGGAGQVGLDGDVEYMANRGQLGLAQSTSYDPGGHAITDMRTTARFDTAIAFTGGHVAIGQPIFDSFAILAPHESLKGAPVVVDPSPDGVLASSGPLGPALVSDIGSYSVRTVAYDVPRAPTGYDIGSGALRVDAPYRAGYFVEVGSDYSVTVIGRLTDADGKPIPLLAGHLIEEAGGQASHKSVEFFTSRDGRFAASGLRPGKWRIVMPTDPETTVEIEVPKNDATLVRVGDLRATPAREAAR
ncbi:MAG TPA: fimbria/pilus outer membrane usher protein [Caulobacteraceae bacterium]|jgi:outer membrane usher protein